MQSSKSILLLLCLAGGSALFGQTGLASLTGQITDPTGAVMPNVTVNAKRVETGLVLQGTTTATGNYTITQMPIGRYEIQIEQPGFKKYENTSLALEASQVLRLDVALEVGNVTESVTVTTEASLLKTDSGQLVHNINVSQLQNLPLMTLSGAGIAMVRDPWSVVQTLPGVVYSNNSFMRVNGLASTAVQYRVEGEVLGQTGFATITTRTQPSPDAIQEVAVQTSNFSAEFGSVSGALFNTTMKSGTNQFHGGAYDYAVNEVLNAGNPALHTKNVERRHDYGFNIGGPVNLPKLYRGTNKTFFFFNFEQFRSATINRVTTAPTVPIQAYRDGDFSSLLGAGAANLVVPTATGSTTTRPYLDPFGNTIASGTIFDPKSTRLVACTAASQDCGAVGSNVNFRTAFPGNKIPIAPGAGYVDPVALAIQQKYIPLPTNSTAKINNYQVPFTQRRLTNLPSIKIDHALRSKGRLSFFWQNTDTSSPLSTGEGLPQPISTNLGTFESSPNARLNFDYTLKPTLNLHIGAGWSQFNFDNRAVVTDFVPATDIGLNGVRLSRNFPAFGSTVTGAPLNLGGMNAMGPTTQSLTPERRPSGSVSLTWTRNSHTIKYGADFRMDMLPRVNLDQTAGNYGFTGSGVSVQPALSALNTTALASNTFTGFGYANFLLGGVRSFNMRTPIVYRTSKQQWGMYLQDSWRVRRNLTVDYGLRWDYGTYTKEDYGRNGGLSLTEPNTAASGRLGGLIFESSCKCKLAGNYPFGIGPRLGIAYTLNSRTVIRGGLGLAYGSTGTFGGTAQANATAQTPVFGDAIFYLRDGVPGSINPQWPVFDSGINHTPGTVIAAPSLLDPNAGRPDRTIQWNLSLQREITRNLVVETSYVGNRGVWQNAGGFVDFNAVSVQDLARLGNGGITIADTQASRDDATMLTTAWTQLSTLQKSRLQALGIGLPYGNFPIAVVPIPTGGNTVAQTPRQAIRNFPQYNSGISPANAPLGRSWYDSLQVTLTKRMSHGLAATANYTWSKNFNYTSTFDVFNRVNGKDIVGINPPQQIRVSFEYQTPRAAAGIPVLGNRAVAEALRGWGLAMVLQYQSAGPLGRPTSFGTAPISNWLGRGPGGAQLKKDADGNYMNPWAVNWTDYDGVVHPEPIDINCHCFDPEKTLVLNPTVWDNIPAATWGAQTQALTMMRGIRIPNESANVSRSFRFGKDGKMALQVRVEFQNVLNRLRLPQPSTVGDWRTAPNKQPDGTYNGGFGSFGNLNSSIFGAQRSGLFVGRFSF